MIEPGTELPVWKHKQEVTNAACLDCRLHENCSKPFLGVVRHSHNDLNGNPTNRILVLSDHPDHRDQEGPGTYYYRGMSQLKNRILNGLDCSWVLTTVVKCAPSVKEKPKPKQNKACEEEHLRALIIQEKPRSVVCLGKEALNSMCRLAGLEPPKNMNDVKGSYIEAEQLNLRIYSAEHQSKFVHQDTNQDALEEHYFKVFEKAEAYALGTDYREKVTFQLLRTPADVMKLAVQNMDRNEFAADIETNYPIFDKRGTKDLLRNSHFKPNFEVISLSVTYFDARSKKYVNAVIVEEGLKDPVPLRRLFRDRRVIMHNHPYDSQGIFMGMGVDVFDICSSVDDTQLCFYLSDQNRLYTNLKDLARHYIDGVGDWEAEGHELVVRANMLIVQQRKALEEAINQKIADAKTWKIYEAGKGQIMLAKDKAAWTRAAKKMIAAGYQSEIDIHKMIETLRLKLKILPLPGLCSYADIPIVKLAEYNAEDTLRTLQLWREIIPQMEKLDGFTYDRDCYEMVKEMIRTACYVQREGFHVNKDKLVSLEERLLGREADIREELLGIEKVAQAAQKTKGYQDATARNRIPNWEKIMSIKNNTFMGGVAEAYGVYHLGNRTETTVTFGKLVIPTIKAFFDRKKNKPEYQEGARVFTLLDELRFNMDLRSKFINNWKNWLCADNKFHPEFKLVANQNLGYARGKDVGGGAQSGRSSCIAEGEFVDCPRDLSKHPYGIPIQDIELGQLVYCYSPEGELKLEPVTAKYDNGIQETIVLHWTGSTNRKDGSLTLTPDHLICLVTGEWVRADSLMPGDRVRSLGRYLPEEGYARLYASGGKCHREHRFIASHTDAGFKEALDVHHLDGNKLNNTPDNLRSMTKSEHHSLHYHLMSDEAKAKRTQQIIDVDRSKIVRNTGSSHHGWIEVSRYSLLKGLAQAAGGPKKLSVLWGVDYETIINKCKLHNIDPKLIAKRYNHVGDFVSRGKVKHAVRPEVRNIDKSARELRIGFRALKSLITYYGIHRNHIITAVTKGPITRVWDLTVANEHNFFANQLLAHNCLKPNLQQLFKLEELREIFEPENPDEWFIAELDYKSLEPMLMAYVTGCDRLKQVFWRALDIYRVTCNDMYRKGVDLNQPDDVVRRLLNDPNTVSAKERKMFKVGFLAWVYGAGKMRLAAALGVTEEEAQDFIRRAQETYYEIFEWKNGIRDLIQQGGFLHTYTGRRRTMPVMPPQDGSELEQERYRKDFGTAFRIGVNFPIQSLGSDITLVQASKVRRWLEREGYLDVVKMVNLVHDSVWFYIKRTHAHLLQKIVEIMEDVSHFKFKIDVPLTIEYTLGYDLSESMGNDDNVMHIRTGMSQAALQELRKLELGITDRKKAA